MKHTTIQIKKRRVNIGDLDKKIIIETRLIKAPNDVDFLQNFSNQKEVWAALQTNNGIELFDGVNLIGVATHFWTIKYIPDTIINFVEFNSQKYKILDIENLDGRNEFLLLKSTLKGDSSKEVNYQ